EAVGLAEPADAQRPEIGLEEFARAILVERHCGFGTGADGGKRFGDCADLARRTAHADERTAACEKCRERRGVIVAGPAVQIAPGPRLVWGVGEFELPRSPAARANGTHQAKNEHRHAERPTTGWRRPHCPASVATTFQLGSREETSRAKVHTSITSVTF